MKPEWKSIKIGAQIYPYESDERAAMRVATYTRRGRFHNRHGLVLNDKNQIVARFYRLAEIIECEPTDLPKKPGKATKATFEVLNNAYAAVRADYKRVYLEHKLEILKNYREGLEAVGMDAEKFAPYPSGNVGREAYRMAVERYSYVRRYFKTDENHPTYNKWASRRAGDPYYVVQTADAIVRLTAEAGKEADALVDSFIHKLAGKIGKDAAQAGCNGRVWDGATLTVICADGEQQQWHTTCILNRSVYNKIFNQWPTRRVK